MSFKIPCGGFKIDNDTLKLKDDGTLYAAGGGGGVQPDWNQNDNTATDYIKNRPFYTGDPVETVLVEESTVAFVEHSGIYGAEFPSTFEATGGETYKITWDGTVYECACSNHGGSLFIGNLSIMGDGSDTGEPFVMMVANGIGISIATTDTASSHTFSISGIAPEVVKIDEKYLPTGDDSPYELKEVGTKKVYVVEFHVESSNTAEKLYNQVNTAYSNGYYVLLYYYPYNAENNPKIYGLSKSNKGTFYFSHLEMYNNYVSIQVITLYPSDGQYKMDLGDYKPYYTNKKADAPLSFYLKSSGSKKLFEIKVDDSGLLSATEVT